MAEVLRRNIIVSLITILFAGLFVYFGIFRTMVSALERSTYANIFSICESKLFSVESTIEKSIEGAKSLSSRTMIKDEIIEYYAGNTGIEELKQFTQPKYEDGVKVIGDIVLAQRMVGEYVVARYDAQENLDLPFKPYHENGLEIYYDLLQLGGGTFITVYSPITDGQTVLGIDIVVCDLTDKLARLSDNEFSATIINVAHTSPIIGDESARIIKQQDENLLVADESGALSFKCPLEYGYEIRIGIDSNMLFKDINEVSAWVLGSSIVVFAIIMIIVYVFIIRYAGRRLNIAEKSRDGFREQAYRDELTGLYSRIFLDHWKQDIRNNEARYSLVMADINEFKSINDKYGHLKGDDVLRAVAHTISGMLRVSDIAVRFGGDEFLIIIDGVSRSEAAGIMKRIEEKLDALEFRFPVSLSYGISMLEAEKELEAAIKLADKHMYAAKQARKAEMNEGKP